MTAGIVGLGLIGGSFAKAYHAAGVKVLAYNRSRDVLDFAIISGDVDAELTEENIGECDIVIIAIFPEAAADYLEKMAPYIGKKPIVIDACGTKRKVCSLCFPIAEKYGFTYLGGHPMAGTQYSGFKYAKANMYNGAPMVLVPPSFDDIELLSKVQQLLSPVGFGKYSVTTADRHDEMIAFTSQLAHVVSSAYIKSPTAGSHKGFSAGSYKDMTRVAKLNPKLWAELFLENRDCILNELNIFIDSISKYRDAIENNDQQELVALLDEGRRRKEAVDGK
ncbi:MAG: prephenate dehydrogenase [Oscillospiraceae bacterium]|nr:prephenate dehydrogenase [Oscillospiraceae bacterium]